MERRAKIVATLGPATSGEQALRALLHAGVDVVRLNLSHGSDEEHRRRCELVRRVAGEEGIHLPVMLDLMGPRYRLGDLAGGQRGQRWQRSLRAGEEVSLGAASAGVGLPVDAPHFLDHLTPGERVLIDGGLVELRVEAIESGRVRARVVHGGVVAARKGINLPDSALPFEISAKDRDDIAFAVAVGADYLAASYVGEAAHLAALRREVEAAGGSIPLVAKLERASAIEHLDEITAAADALMVARGDLGVEVALATVPVLQKKIIAAARRAGKPVIVATQMLESMIEQPRPTRAEATDVANAVLDGADALMLSGETAVGRFPVEVITTMAGIIQEAEAYARASSAANPAAALPGSPGPPPRQGELPLEVPDLVSAAAVHAASQLGVSLIVAFSLGGSTARLVARYRPAASIIAFTPDPRVARQAQLVWGVRRLLASDPVVTLDDVVRVVERQLLGAGLVRPGDRILILMGHPIRDRPPTNLMRVHRIGRPAGDGWAAFPEVAGEGSSAAPPQDRHP